jgi:hypothetical protein
MSKFTVKMIYLTAILILCIWNFMGILNIENRIINLHKKAEKICKQEKR